MRTVPVLRETLYSFPEVVLASGAEAVVKADVRGAFRPEKLAMIGLMDEVRGHFRIRRTRRPPLDREHVIAYSNVMRVASRRRTTVEYRYGASGNFVRSYLPENVVYVHTDPLSYVTLDNIFSDDEEAMSTGFGVSAAVFGPGVFGNSLCMPLVSKRVTLCLKNRGDVQVRVFASVFGCELASAAVDVVAT